MSELRERVDPRQAAVIVVDVQNDFCADGGFMDREGEDVARVRRMVPRLERFLERARAAGARMVFIQAIYGTEANWYLSEAWLERARRSLRGGHTEYRVCGAGEWGAEFYQVRPDPGRPELVVQKHRYSAFLGTELETVLRSGGVRTVILTGVASNVCVESTARDAFMRDFHVVMLEDCCEAYLEKEHRAALWNVAKYFGQVVSSEALAEAWSVREPA